MFDLFSESMRRDPYPAYASIRAQTPLYLDERSGLWMVFDYDGVRQLLSDHDRFSSRYGPDWLIFTDPPLHNRLRGLISKAFTPASIMRLEARITEISRELIDAAADRGEMDLARDVAVPLPMRVIAEMLGIGPDERDRLTVWNDAMVQMSLTIGRTDAAASEAFQRFVEVTAEMRDELARMLDRRRREPGDDLLTRLSEAELDGERLSLEEILSFFQPLLLGGTETTTNLVTSTILSLIENPSQFDLLHRRMELLPSAIEESLRYRSPIQWMYRITRKPAELHGQTIPTGKLVLAMLGSANRDPRQFRDPDCFQIERSPNPHIAFGLGRHFCLGAPLARLEAKIALTHLLTRLKNIRLDPGHPWQPRPAPHVLGASRMPIRFEPV